MTEKSDNRTIKEIKARIDYCRNAKTAKDCMSCPYDEDDACASEFMFDSFDYMQYLESELAEARKDVDMLGEQAVALDGAYNAMKRERDAAVKRLKDFSCGSCKHECVAVNAEPCQTCFNSNKWEFDGVEVE